MLSTLTEGAESLQQLRDAVALYIERKSDPETERKWAKQFEEKVNQRASDTNVDNERAAQLIAYDWAADNRKELNDYRNAKAKTVIEACRMLDWFFKNEVPLPERLRSQLTPETTAQAATYFKELAEKK